jgi:hypothetical protein
MDDPPLRTPDSIEPISAYRAWFYSIEGRSARLFPLSGSMMASDWEGAGARWVTASCPRFGSATHEVPSEVCSCGFYSLKELGVAVRHAGIFRLSTYGQAPVRVVLGRILLSGKVIEHETGYRAERARVAELIPFRGTERSIMVLANRLGVGMAPAVEPGSPEEIFGPVGTLPSRRRRSPEASPDPLRSPAAGVLAIVGLIAASIIVLAGGPPLLPLVLVSILQLGRSSDSMAKAYRDWRDWRGSGSNRPRFLPPVPPAPASS